MTVNVIVVAVTLAMGGFVGRLARSVPAAARGSRPPNGSRSAGTNRSKLQRTIAAEEMPTAR